MPAFSELIEHSVTRIPTDEQAALRLDSRSARSTTPVRLAVLTPAYNDPLGLKRTYDSLVSQNIPLTWFLVDDGSSPILELPTRHPPFDVQLIRLVKNSGITNALNTGLAEIFCQDFDFLARLDAGDVALPGKFRKQLDELLRNSQLGALGTWVRLIDAEGKELLTRRLPATHAQILARHRRTSGMVHSSVMLRLDVLREVGFYSPSYPYAEDFDLWLRVQKKADLGNIPEVLLAVEVRPGSISTSKRRTQVRSRISLVLREFNPMVPQAYVGLVANLFLYCVSYSQSLRIKRWLTKLRCTS